MGGTNSDYGSGVYAEKDGNILLTGAFLSSSISFGTYTLTNTSGTPNINSYSANMFFVKLDPNGQIIWAKKEGGQSEGISIASDISGNVFVLGNFYSNSITFGSTTYYDPTNYKFSSDIFLNKYDSSGNILWSRAGMGSFSDIAAKVCTDLQGNVIATGYFYSDSLSLGTSLLNNASATSAPGSWSDVFIIKYNPSGNLAWGKVIGGNMSDYVIGLSSDQTGNIAVCGGFESPILAIGSNTFTKAGGATDGFVAEFNSAGSVVWSESAKGSYDEELDGVSFDANGNVFLAGTCKDSVTIGNTLIYNNGQIGLFFAKLNSTGLMQWDTFADGSAQDHITSSCTDYQGNFIVAGYMFGPTLTYGNVTLTNANNGGNSSDMFVAKIGNTPTGIRGVENNSYGINVYPNPSVGKMILRSDLALSLASIMVIDNQGIVVKQMKGINTNPGQPTILSFENLRPGLYILRVEEEGKMIGTEKLIISE